MPNYSWREFEKRPWSDRFPDWAYGYSQWRSQRESTEFLRSLQWLPRLADSEPHQVRLRCPRVFVSHRQGDMGFAERIAYLASNEGFEFWLDVWDPQLQALQVQARFSLKGEQKAQAIASVIEMVLLNSTHVLAEMSPDTRGSLWVPYEYGRVKDEAVLSFQAACWTHPALRARDFPEYLRLGAVHRTEHEMRGGFGQELSGWRSVNRDCMNGAAAPWGGGITHPLPEA